MSPPEERIATSDLTSSTAVRPVSCADDGADRPNGVRAQLLGLFETERFAKLHPEQLGDPNRDNRNLENVARDMLYGTMDENRVYDADEFTRRVLRLSDIDDAMQFREGVRHKELGGRIAYAGQRDHGLHTAYNYLLGWYIYENSPAFRNSFRVAVEARGKPIAPERREAIVDKLFRTTWSYASLLHDVGYLFEGSLNNLDFRDMPDEVRDGANIAATYFESRLWREVGLTSASMRRDLLKATGVPLPDFRNPTSLHDLGLRLRDLDAARSEGADAAGDLATFEKAVEASYQAKFRRPAFNADRNTQAKTQGCLQADIFDVWKSHYDQLENSAMSKRFESARLIFDAGISDGAPGFGARVINHGVAGGLLLLHFATTYYRLRAAADHLSPEGVAGESPADQESISPVIREFQRLCAARAEERSTCVNGESDYDAQQWWSRIVWATAATGLHDMLQQYGNGGGGPTTLAGTGLEPLAALALNEDPLTWLGVLVDSIQCWDRYPVFRAASSRPSRGASRDKRPIESRHVSIRRDGNLDTGGEHIAPVMFSIGLPSKSVAEKIRKELSHALSDWGQHLEITYDGTD